MTANTVLFFQSNSWNHDNLKHAGLTEAAQRFGWRVQLVASPTISEATLTGLLDFWHPLGCIVDCGNRNSIPPPNYFGNTPAIYLDCQRNLFGKRANYVSHDSDATVSLCVRELLTLGYVNFAYIGHYNKHYWSEERRRHFVKIVEAHNLGHSEYVPQSITELEYRRGLEAFLGNLDTPCGILCANDEIGEMVIVAANRLELQIPDTLSIVSIDNNPSVCETLSPTLSSASIDFYRAGQLSAVLLRKVTNGKRRTYESATFGPLGIVRRISSSQLKDSTVARMVDYIRKNALSPIMAMDVTKICRGSRRNAEIRFRKAAGRSIIAEVHLVRIESAQKLLADSNYQVSEIAHMCGYHSESYFRKLFKRMTGLSPLAYRKQPPSTMGR